MRKALLIPALFLVLTLIYFLSPRPVSSQSCIPDFQSCDQNNPCCNFPSVTCQGGYCQPASPSCGTNTLPCCDPPNPQCGSGLKCIGNYCVVPPQPSASPPPVPSIPTSAPTATPGVGGGSSSNVALCNNSSIDTAIGCIPFDSESNFIGFILSWAIGIGGGVAFIMMLFAGFQIMTSAGNPDRLRAGQELLTSAIAGLILLVFSVFILRVIGIDILGISSLGQ